ncbi:hypothetical protein AYJ57_20495 (plasmid) [Salipiger sp. CCB-MM3]|uniref:ABC transporter ATP-binding protein n=1 Tax=Salipiger sp. CCB-MM3 TaxID=1792508 RepID=UPI00080AB67B|nr:ABC transporter ATP-binding protein [Salipiger sp. CCB-MM3]ANT62868.1 hypothetical protein AYJ57_20495 [Salipiger sp. CCB-MM3]
MYITLDGISKEYSGFWAIDRANMSIGREEFISLLGPSGSGKTTLLRMIAGLERPTRGRVIIDGQDVTALPPHRRGVAMVFQEFLLFPHRTVAENLAFPLRMMKMSRSDIEERLRWIVSLMSLDGLEDRYPNQLSGGQQQRVALGRGLVGKPKALLLDEPLANLDRELRQEMEIEIRRHQATLGIPFIYVTHNQEEALSMSDRIAVVRKGRIEDFAERSAVYDTPKTSFIAQFVGRSNKFDGHIAAGGTILETNSGLQLALPPEGPRGIPGTPAQAFVKVEKISLSPIGDGFSPRANTLACTVRDIILRGPQIDYILDAGSLELSVSSPRATKLFEPGARVLAEWKPGDIDVFAVASDKPVEKVA